MQSIFCQKMAGFDDLIISGIRVRQVIPTSKQILKGIIRKRKNEEKDCYVCVLDHIYKTNGKLA
jgi:hypothetical protein